MTNHDYNHLATINPATGKADVSIAPKGLAWAATPVTRAYVDEAGLDERFVMPHRFNTRLTLCYMVLCPESIARWYNNDQKREEKKDDRLGRCLITSEITGKPIRCPDSKSCIGCPNAVMENNAVAALSYEKLIEENGYEAAVHDTTSDVATNSMAIEQMLSELSDIKELLPTILNLRAQGLTPKEIGEVLGIKKTKLYDSLNTIERIAEKYF